MADNTLADPDRLRALAASLGYFVDSIAGLRQHRGQASEQIFLRGYAKPGDGAEGYFTWDNASALKDDGGTIIDPSDASQAGGGGRPGRWIRMNRGQHTTPYWWGARFDDLADDTDAIQSAIDYAIATGGDVLLPPGTAKITRPLMLASKGHRPHSGFRFSGRAKFGDSGSSMRDGSGTLLKYYGPADSAEAILNLDGSLWRYTTISNLSLVSQTPFACKYGLLFSSTEFSQHVIDSVTVANVRVAYAIRLSKGGGNGEFTYFTNCSASNVECFFHNNSGQAFNQRFEHCNCGLLPGGTYFDLDVTGGISPGGGMIVTDFNATGGNSGDPNPPTNSTLFRSTQSSPPVIFLGGRVEHLTRLIDLGADFVGLNLTIRGMDITVDYDPALKKTGVAGFITVQNNPAVITVADCSFGAVKRTEVLGIDLMKCTDYGPLIRFTGCRFGNFLAAPRVDGFRHDLMSSVKFTDCRLSSTFREAIRGGGYGNDRKQPLNYEWGAMQANEAVRMRSLSSVTARAVSGRPSNLIAAPAICALPGDAQSATPDAPWSAIGKAGGITIARGDRADEKIRSSSGWERIVTLQPGAGLYQDIAQIDLASDEGTSRYFYVPVHELYYQAMLRWVAGKGALRLALENSVTGEIFDETTFKTLQAQQSGPHLVSLLARVPPLQQTAHFRLTIKNSGPDPVSAAIAWQFASPRLDASFVGLEGVSELKEDWAVSAESMRAWDRFMLPYKRDATGSAAPRPARDLYSDQYMSADDGRLTYFAGDAWCKAPRTSYGGAPPDRGTWRVGDQLLNQAPKAGTYVGWICVTAGSPGEWRPFGLIA